MNAIGFSRGDTFSKMMLYERVQILEGYDLTKDELHSNVIAELCNMSDQHYVDRKDQPLVVIDWTHISGKREKVWDLIRLIQDYEVNTLIRLLPWMFSEDMNDTRLSRVDWKWSILSIGNGGLAYPYDYLFIHKDTALTQLTLGDNPYYSWPIMSLVMIRRQLFAPTLLTISDDTIKSSVTYDIDVPNLTYSRVLDILKNVGGDYISKHRRLISTSPGSGYRYELLEDDVRRIKSWRWDVLNPIEVDGRLTLYLECYKLSEDDWALIRRSAKDKYLRKFANSMIRGGVVSLMEGYVASYDEWAMRISESIGSVDRIRKRTEDLSDAVCFLVIDIWSGDPNYHLRLIANCLAVNGEKSEQIKRVIYYRRCINYVYKDLWGVVSAPDFLLRYRREVFNYILDKYVNKYRRSTIDPGRRIGGLRSLGIDDDDELIKRGGVEFSLTQLGFGDFDLDKIGDILMGYAKDMQADIAENAANLNADDIMQKFGEPFIDPADMLNQSELASWTATDAARESMKAIFHRYDGETDADYNRRLDDIAYYNM